MIGRLLRKTAAFRSDESGASFILVTMALPLIFGMAAFSIDLGHAFYVKSRLQTAADIGALAGGSLIGKGNAAAVEALALSYVQMNLPAGWQGDTATPIKAVPHISAKCLTSIDVPCKLPEQPNAVHVDIDITMPTYFAAALGFTTTSMSASAMAGGGGSAPPPLNVAIVLDATASMEDPYDDSKGGKCGNLVAPKKIECAMNAARGMLGTLWPSVDQVGLYVYPSPDSASLPILYCGSTKATSLKNVNYKTSSKPSYRVVGLKADYRGAGTPPPPGLNTDSDLVKALGGSPPCKGLYRKGEMGGSGTYYADAIKTAQADLVAANDALEKAGQPTRQNVLVLLSDGDAQAASDKIDDINDQCLRGIAESQAATAAGTWVYSVAFQSSTTAGSSCKNDKNVTVTKKVVVTQYTNTWKGSRCTLSSKVIDPGKATTVVQPISAPSGIKTVLTTTPSPVPPCNKNSGPVVWTETTQEISSPTSPVAARSACQAMKDMASDPSKFYSIPGSSKCNSEGNPTVLDLMSIFKHVAVSLMKKRRIPVNVN